MQCRRNTRFSIYDADRMHGKADHPILVHRLGRAEAASYNGSPVYMR